MDLRLDPIQELSLWPWRLYLPLLSLWNRGAITRGPAQDRVALTFDDGPDGRFTPAMLETLDRFQARATFFMLGAQIERAPDLAREVASRGHELAVHLFSHDRAAARDHARFREELLRTVALVQEAAGRPPRFLRLPFAYLGKQTPRRIRDDFGLRTAHWSFSLLDSRYAAARIEQRFRRAVFPGAIALLHDGVGPHSSHGRTRQPTLEALPGVIATCRERGLEPVTLSELLG